MTNGPNNNFDGFSPLEMDYIIFSPFEDDCPIKINILNKEILFNQSPVLKIIIELLSRIGEEGIKLTLKGNLPIKVIKDIYNQNLLPDRAIDLRIIKIHTETDWILLHNVRLVLTMAGLIRKKKNMLLLTKKRKNLQKEENYSKLFYDFMKSFTLQFFWAYNDRFENQDIGQIAFLYSLYLINKYGDEFRDMNFYSNLYLTAFPSMLEYADTSQESYSLRASSYQTRFIERFAIWFGFVEEEIIEGKHYFDRRIRIKRTKLLQELLQVNAKTLCSIYRIDEHSGYIH